jgi:hypothetical protein
MTIRRALPLLATLLATSTAARGEDPSPSPDRPGVVRLHIEANVADVELRERVPAGRPGPFGEDDAIERHVCRAPCDRVLDGRDGHEFFFDGTPWDAPDFSLRGYQGDVIARLTVHRHLRNGGIALATSSGLAIIGGAITLGLGVGKGSQVIPYDASCTGTNPAPTCTYDQTHPSYDSGLPLRIAGGVALGAGGAMLIAGIVMLVHGRTQLELVGGKVTADAGSLGISF